MSSMPKPINIWYNDTFWWTAVLGEGMHTEWEDRWFADAVGTILKLQRHTYYREEGT